MESQREGSPREVTVQELREVSQAWRPGRTSGPDGITYEALKAILDWEEWGDWLRGHFNSVLCTGELPPAWGHSLTVLLPKTAQPGAWKDTRLIRVADEWGLPLLGLLAKLDVRHAFDRVSQTRVAQMLRERWERCIPGI